MLEIDEQTSTYQLEIRQINSNNMNKAFYVFVREITWPENQYRMFKNRDNSEILSSLGHEHRFAANNSTTNNQMKVYDLTEGDFLQIAMIIADRFN